MSYVLELKYKFTSLPSWLKWIYYVVLFQLGLLICFLCEVPSFYKFAELSKISEINSVMLIMKQVGHFSIWLIAGFALIIIDLPKIFRNGYRYLNRAAFLVSSALLSGLSAEILKLIIRRERPDPLFFNGSVFRGWVGAWWKSNNLGTPSSHAMVAFGGVWALCVLFPRARIIWISAAVFCGLSRMAHQAHLLGDVYIACILSYIIAMFLAKKFNMAVYCRKNKREEF